MIIAIYGPTASGKSALALRLAQLLDTEIISVDSRQVYKELKIGVARPSVEELAQVKHHLVASHSVRDALSAASYSTLARRNIDEVVNQNGAVVIGGGTTLYMRAILQGLSEVPDVSLHALNASERLLEREGIAGLRHYLLRYDPETYARIDLNNPRRLLRAVSIHIGTGKPFSYFLRKKGEPLPYPVLKLQPSYTREGLYNNINNRCDSMLAHGLLEEVNNLQPHQYLTTLDTVGYREFFDYLDGKASYAASVELFKRNTRRYAKRQITMLRQEQNLRTVRSLEEACKDYEDFLRS